jgi:hypothetical protein
MHRHTASSRSGLCVQFSWRVLATEEQIDGVGPGVVDEHDGNVLKQTRVVQSHEVALLHNLQVVVFCTLLTPRPCTSARRFRMKSDAMSCSPRSTWPALTLSASACNAHNQLRATAIDPVDTQSTIQVLKVIAWTGIKHDIRASMGALPLQHDTILPSCQPLKIAMPRISSVAVQQVATPQIAQCIQGQALTLVTANVVVTENKHVKASRCAAAASETGAVRKGEALQLCQPL